MFDVSQEIAFPAPLRLGTADPIVIRWPSDQEWIERARSKKFVKRRLGRGQEETVPPMPGEPELKLYQAVSLNGNPEITPAEAEYVFDVIGRSMIQDVQIEGNEALVTLQVMGGTVKHRLRVPTADEILRYRRAYIKVIDLPHNQQQVTLNPAPGAELYDACGGKSSDYAGAVPGIHKADAAKAAIDAVEQRLAPKGDDASF